MANSLNTVCLSSCMGNMSLVCDYVQRKLVGQYHTALSNMCIVINPKQCVYCDLVLTEYHAEVEGGYRHAFTMPE